MTRSRFRSRWWVRRCNGCRPTRISTFCSWTSAPPAPRRRARWSLRFSRPTPASRGTPPPAAATSRPRSRPASWSRCRCSSRRARRCGSTPAAGSTSRGRRVCPVRRSDQRRDAVFAVYQHEVTGRPLHELLEGAKPFTRELAEGVVAHKGELDELIGRHSKGWTVDRIAPLERSIMRVALYEALHPDDIPAGVAADEAVELTKESCGTDAPGFVNGVLR